MHTEAFVFLNEPTKLHDLRYTVLVYCKHGFYTRTQSITLIREYVIGNCETLTWPTHSAEHLSKTPGIRTHARMWMGELVQRKELVVSEEVAQKLRLCIEGGEWPPPSIRVACNLSLELLNAVFLF